MLATRLAAVLGCALTFSLPAQTGGRFLGLTVNGPTIRSQDFTTCAEQECNLVFPGLAANPCAGGCAYDSRTRGTWVTNGSLIAKFDTRDPACPEQCPVQTLATSGPGAVATGMAFDHALNRLLVTDSNGVLTTFQINGCSLTIVSQCLVPLPPGLTITGIAFDASQQRLLYCISNCEAAAAGGIVAIAAYADPCNLLCASALLTCPDGSVLGTLVGLTYDACTDEIWATDGLRVVAARLNPSDCATMPLRCCDSPNPFVGLSIEPPAEETVGIGCTSAPCANCAPVHFFGNGDSIIGNLDFTLDASGLPSGAMCVFLLNVGPCTPPGFTLPPFCAPLLVPAAGVLSFSQPVNGAGGCTGTASLDVSLPLNLANCGFVMSSQVLGSCQPGAGTFVTNCLTWVVGS